MARMRLRELYAQHTKAFPYNISLTDAGGPLYYGGAPAAYNVYSPGPGSVVAAGRIQTPISQRAARLHLQTYGGGEAIDWLMDAVNFTITAASSADWHFEDKGKKLVREKSPLDPSDVEIAPQPLLQLFDEPNPFMQWADLLELTLIDWLLVGNAYWVKWQTNSAGQPLALYRMCPEYVRIVPGQYGPQQYLYRLPGQRDEVTFSPDQILHFKRPNPNDPYYGMGIVQGGARALDMELALTRTMASYYEKQAMPSGVVQTERRVPRDVFNKLKMQLRSFYGGQDNAGQLMVLEAGLNYKPLSPTAAQARFQELGAWSRDRVLAMFNMSALLLGIPVATTVPIGDWQLLFDRKTMIPLTARFSRAISHGLTRPGWGLDFKIDYEETQQPDQVLKRAQTLAALPGAKVKEVRAAAKLPPTGDPSIDDYVLNIGGPNMDAHGQGGTADRNLIGESGRPPIADNVPNFGVPAPPPAKPSKGGRVAKPGKKAIDDLLFDLDTHLIELEHKALPPADHVHVGQLAGDHVHPPEDTLRPKRRTDIAALRDDTAAQLAAAAHKLERGLLDATEGKAEGTVYQRVKNSKAWSAFRDRVTEILDAAAQAAMSLANVHHTGSGLDTAEIDYEAAAQEIIHARKVGVNGVLDTLKKRVLDRVLTGQRGGEGAVAIQRAIRDAIAAWEAPKIAQDTSNRAYNEATVAVAEANGLKDVLVSDGEDSDEPCRKANGVRWSLAKARDNLIEHPNCQRAFVPVV